MVSMFNMFSVLCAPGFECYISALLFIACTRYVHPVTAHNIRYKTFYWSLKLGLKPPHPPPPPALWLSCQVAHGNVVELAVGKNNIYISVYEYIENKLNLEII